MPEVSVVIPTYNAAETLILQLLALFAQDPGFEFEVIVADNGSTDDTRDALQAYFSGEQRLRVVDASTQRGGGYAKNVGVAAARSACVAFCDADDLVASNWLIETHRALQRWSVVSIPREYGLLNGGKSVAIKAGVRTMFGLPVFSGGAFACLTELYEAAGGFNASFQGAVDDEFALRLYTKFRREVGSAETLVHVRAPQDPLVKARRSHLLARSVPLLASIYDKRPPSTILKVGAVRWARLMMSAAALPFSTGESRQKTLVSAAVATGYLVGSVRDRSLYL